MQLIECQFIVDIISGPLNAENEEKLRKSQCGYDNTFKDNSHRIVVSKLSIERAFCDACTIAALGLLSILHMLLCSIVNITRATLRFLICRHFSRLQPNLQLTASLYILYTHSYGTFLLKIDLTTT